MARKKYFFVFCAIFVALALVLAWGAWRKHAEIEARGGAERSDREPPRGLEAERPGAGTLERLSDPPPSSEARAEREAR